MNINIKDINKILYDKIIYYIYTYIGNSAE